MYLFRHITLCHILLISSAVLLCFRKRTIIGLCFIGIGFGGLGAAWSRHTDQEEEWLHIYAGKHHPDKKTVRCAGEHLPFALVGIYLLLKHHGV